MEPVRKRYQKGVFPGGEERLKGGNYDGVREAPGRGHERGSNVYTSSGLVEGKISVVGGKRGEGLEF